MEFKLGVVLLNYNSYQDTIRLVSELYRQTISDKVFIVVVDNCSPNNSFKYLKSQLADYQNIVVLQTNENLGYARGNNFGLHYLETNIQPEYVAILNNDIWFDNDCFSKLIDKYEVLESPAIIAPNQFDIDKNIIPLYKLNSFVDDVLDMFYFYRFFYKKRKTIKAIDNTGFCAVKVDIVPGSFLFSSFINFKKIGFFDPVTFLFTEERFIAERVKKVEKQNYIILDLYYVHAHSKTINRVHNNVSKYKMLYAGWISYTKKYRRNPLLKTVILKILITYSLFEIVIIQLIKKSLNRIL